MQMVAVVSGASSGIGQETAIYLSRNGYKVYGLARRRLSSIPLEKSGVSLFEADLSDDKVIIEVIERIQVLEGKIDVLINCAGFGCYGSVEDVPLKDAKYQMEVNLFSVARLVQLVLPGMRERQFGKIVNISSVGGKMATPMGGWYHASKYALEGLSDSLRLEVKSFGIDVILIEPGGVKTEWAGIAFEHLREVSGNSVYQNLVKKTEDVINTAQSKAVLPHEIALLIKRVIEDKKPKARYVSGYMAKPILFFKKWLSDRLFDKMVSSQFYEKNDGVSAYKNK